MTAVLAVWWACVWAWTSVASDDPGLRLGDRYAVAWLGREQGLPGGGATVMVQAPDGYLWFGTFNGVARYDGIGFKVFTPGNTPGLPSAGIVHAHADRRGRIWVSTYKGLASLQDGTWRSYGPGEGWTADYARTFAEGPDGTIYVTAFNGRVLRHRDGHFEEMPPVPDENHGGFGHCDAEGRFWVAKDAFVGFWDGAGWRRVPVSWEPVKTAEGLGAGPARDGKLWLVRERQLLKVGVAGVVRKFRLDCEVSSFWRLYEDTGGDLWISSRQSGLFHVRIPTESLSEGGSEVARVAQVGSAGNQGFTATTFVSQDDEGNLWVGTASEGVSRWRRKAVENLGAADGLTHGNIRSVAVEPSGRLWVGSYGGGLYRGDIPSQGRPRLDPVVVEDIKEVESVLVDREGGVWVTGLGNGLPVYRIQEGRVRRMYRDGDRHGTRGPMWEGADGRIWVGGVTELVSYFRGDWTRHGLEGVRIMAEDVGTGRLWMVSGQGLFQKQKDGFQEVKDASGRSLGTVTCLAPAAGLGLWMGWVERGLGLLRDDGQVVDLGPSVGTIMHDISIIHDDGHGGLWLAGDQGLVRVAVADLQAVATGLERRVKARLFDSDSGLSWNAHSLYARQLRVPRSPDGRLWFPTSKGLVAVDPLALGVSPRVPRLLPGPFRYLDAAGRMHEEAWADGGIQRIPPGARALRVEFAALYHAAPGRVTCATRLEKDGRILAERFGDERHAAYELLPPGSYNLRVLASNEDGVWTPEGLGLRIVVDPHYWQTWWFRLLVFAGFVGLVMAAAGYWVRQTRMKAQLALAEHDRRAAVESAEKSEALRRSEALRLQAEAEAEWRRRREAVIRDVHDGIGGLASNLKMTLSLAQRAPDPGSQRSMLTAMDALVGETLMEVHGLMDALESEVSTMGELADEFRRHGGVVLQPHGIVLVLEWEGRDRPLPRTPEFFLALFRMFKEALSNVVKHSGARRVEVVLASSDQGLTLRIHDDGEGIGSGIPAPGGDGPGPMARHGRGLSGMRRRAADLGGSLRIESGAGLQVVIEVPWPSQPCLG